MRRRNISVKRPLRFYDIAAGKTFVTDQYEVVEIKSSRGAVRLAVAKSPYTGNECYSFAPKRPEIRSATLNGYL
ncbi:hypothetical protein TUZN_2169 [Thermoproteus uzoniensis 768-20]|uniref:Uncharacterized protein n=1 Tax=Thermoproteus uzoniensis (strain 768-20) TaxID=999630 RepID=F2L5S8_THEU7|nr:hypothetical protein TUZN_2169 [Thermoproteus uzoniensis 768-20]